MGKTSDKLRQAKRREKLKQDEKEYKTYLEKDRMRKRLKRMEHKSKTMPEQEAHKAAERVRIRNYRVQKKKEQQAAIIKNTPIIESPYAGLEVLRKRSFSLTWRFRHVWCPVTMWHFPEIFYHVWQQIYIYKCFICI